MSARAVLALLGVCAVLAVLAATLVTGGAPDDVPPSARVPRPPSTPAAAAASPELAVPEIGRPQERETVARDAGAEAAPAAGPLPGEIEVRFVSGGAPAPDVRAEAWLSGATPRVRAPLGSAAADADGRASWTRPRPLPLACTELHLDVRPEGRAGFLWRGPIPLEPVEIEVPEAAALEGAVYFAEDGEPVAGGRIFFECERQDGSRASARAEVRDGRYETAAELFGHLVRARVSLGDAAHPVPIEGLELRPGSRARLDVAIPAGPDVELRFVDAADGTPVEGVSVQAHDHSASDESDERGVAVLRRALIGKDELRLQARHDDYAPREVRIAPAPGETSVVREVALSRGFTLAGELQDADGRPLPGRDLRLRIAEGSAPAGNMTMGWDLVERRARTGPAGEFQLARLPASDAISIGVHGEGGLEGWLRARLPADADRRIWRLPATAGVDGVVRRGAAPVEGASVKAQGVGRARSATATTAADGSFVLEGLEPGPWLVGASYGPECVGGVGRDCRRREVVQVDVSEGGRVRVEIDLPPEDAPAPMPVPIALHLVDARTGAGVRGAWIELIGVDVDSQWATSTDEATWEEALPEGAYRIWILHPLYAPREVPVDLSDPPALPLRVELEPREPRG